MQPLLDKRRAESGANELVREHFACSERQGEALLGFHWRKVCRGLAEAWTSAPLRSSHSCLCQPASAYLTPTALPCSDLVAIAVLKRSEWNLEAAVDGFFSMGVGMSTMSGPQVDTAKIGQLFDGYKGASGVNR